MKKIEGQIFDEERALYATKNTIIENCQFDGPADGESVLKESRGITVKNCFFNLRYPFWHNSRVKIENCRLTELCRAALWYVDHAEITSTKLHGIKALRECHEIMIKDCDIISPEFGWSVCNCEMENTSAASEYFMMRSENLDLSGVSLEGKYSFQYIRNASVKNCRFNTKDAFWHSKNVTVENSEINGEYLGWYSDHLTFLNCKISGTQPLCYATNLKLINCEMNNTDLAFEKSDVDAVLTAPIDSIKNPIRGTITVPTVGEIIIDDEKCACKIVEKNKVI